MACRNTGLLFYISKHKFPACPARARRRQLGVSNCASLASLDARCRNEAQKKIMRVAPPMEFIMRPFLQTKTAHTILDIYVRNDTILVVNQLQKKNY